MAFAIGIDAGSSATKIIGMNEDRHLYLAPMRVKIGESAEDFRSALMAYLDRSNVKAEEVGRVAVTGGRADKIGDSIDDIPVVRADEFNSIACGALEFSGQERGVVANMGTGVCFIYAEKGKNAVHIGGSGVGGGTLRGLCSRLAYVDRIDDILGMAQDGKLENVDLMISDLALEDLKSLDPKMTLSNFGKIGDTASTADMVLGVINLVLQNTGTLALFAAQARECETVIVSGALADLPQARPCYENFEKIYGVNFPRCAMPAFVTAAGTILSTAKQ